MRLFCWNINALLPTEANFRHTYGSFKGFLQEKKADIACFQVRSGHPAGRDQPAGNDTRTTSMQETKIRELAASLKDIACLEGWESIFAIATAEGQRGRHGGSHSKAGRCKLSGLRIWHIWGEGTAWQVGAIVLWLHAGVATYVSEGWSPVMAEQNCFGDNEGRCAALTDWQQGLLLAASACLCAMQQ